MPSSGFRKRILLAPVEIPVPKIRADQALIRVMAAGANPSAAKNLASHFGTELPRILGRDYAGVVAAGTERKRARLTLVVPLPPTIGGSILDMP